MKKRICRCMLVTILLSVFAVLSGCGSSGNGGVSSEEEKNLETEVTETENDSRTLVEMMNSEKGVVIYGCSAYGTTTYFTPPKDAMITSAYVFKNGGFVKYSNIESLGIAVGDLNNTEDSKIVERLEKEISEWKPGTEGAYSRSFSRGEWIIGVFTDASGNKVSRAEVIGYLDGEYVPYLYLFDELYKDDKTCSFQIYDTMFAGWNGYDNTFNESYCIFVRGNNAPEIGKKAENIVLDKGDGFKGAFVKDDAFVKAADAVRAELK